eukprot:3063244-Rhodomonas_salina.1
MVAFMTTASAGSFIFSKVPRTLTSSNVLFLEPPCSHARAHVHCAHAKPTCAHASRPHAHMLGVCDPRLRHLVPASDSARFAMRWSSGLTASCRVVAARCLWLAIDMPMRIGAECVGRRA